jgi:predicted acylesterase/phospholipase RssA
MRRVLGGRPTAAAAALGLCAFVGACTTSRPEKPEPALLAHQQDFIADRIDTRVRISRAIVSRMYAQQEAARRRGEPPPPFDILIISGGGDFGAFGAGVLKGWGTVTDPVMARPVFDFVSGVSTGALIAPLAFVGSEDAYERAFQVYQNPKPEWFRERGLLTFVLTGKSLVDNTGLKEEIKASIDDSMIRDIARDDAEGRLLIIGTTNLDMGMLAMWDLGQEARRVVEGVHSRDRLDSIILASTAIPGVFPPVEIDGDLYVDGGVTRNIAYTTDQDSPNAAFNRWQHEHGDRPPSKIRFWILINNQLATPPKSMQPGWTSLMKRSLEMAVRSSTIGALKGLAVSMELVRTERAADIEFRYMAIPDDWRPPVEGTFKKETMTALAQLGYRMGRDPSNWQVLVPNPESPEPATDDDTDMTRISPETPR